jgi:DnaJ-class molecular chaperone
MGSAKSDICKLCNGKGYYRQSGGSFTEPCGGCGGSGKRDVKPVGATSEGERHG